MIKVFNTHALTSNQRFTRAIVVGVPTALVGAVVYGLFLNFFAILYVGLGWAIGTVIKKYGRGVQPKFSFLAAGLTLISILLADLIGAAGLTILLHPIVMVQLLVLNLPAYFITNPGVLLGTLFRAGAVYFAYVSARII